MNIFTGDVDWDANIFAGDIILPTTYLHLYVAIFRLFRENKVCIQFEARTIVIGQENKETSKYETQILNRGGHLFHKFINKSVSAGFAVTKYVDTMALSETQIYLTALLNSRVAFFIHVFYSIIILNYHHGPVGESVKLMRKKSYSHLKNWEVVPSF